MTTHRAPCLALVLALAAVRCSSPAVEEVETTAPVPVEVKAAVVATVESRIHASGLVAPAPGADWTIVAPEAARIAQISKAEGDAVNAGDVLVRFDIPTLASNLSGRRAEVAQARARLETARAAVTRLTGLVDRGIASRREVQEAERDRAEAEAALARAESDAAAARLLADRAVVTARFSGVIAKRWHNPGDLVDASSSDPILRVIDPRTLQVVASVPAADLVRIVVGRPAEVTGPGGGDPEEITVSTKAAQMDQTGSVGEVRLTFKARTRFTAGMPVQVSIVGEQHVGVVTVPTEAVLHDGEEAFVMVAGTDNVAHRQVVTLGLEGDGAVEIVKGVAAGDRVIVRGQTALPDGAAVAVGQ
jgi:RND family efflux transporter MFP subunit